MKNRCTKAVILCSLCLWMTGCPLSVHKKPETHINFSAYIAKGFYADGINLVTRPVSEGFLPYDFKPFSGSSGRADLKYVVKLVFSPEGRHEKAFFLPSLFYPVEIFLNGKQVRKSGFDDITNRYHSAYGLMVPLPSDVLKEGEDNVIAIRFFPQHVRQTFGQCFIGSSRDVFVYKFWYGFFHCTMITIFCAISFFYFLIFFSLWVSGKFYQKTYLYFSLLCFSLIFSYPNLIFSGLTINELLLTKVSRISFNAAAVFFIFFSMEYTKVIPVKFRKLTDPLLYSIIFLVTFAFMVMIDTRSGINVFFNFLSKIVITPPLIISPVLFTIAWLRIRNVRSLIIMLTIYFLAGTSLHDLVYYKKHLSPYIWLLPVGYLGLEVVISLILALEQGDLMKRIAGQTNALRASNQQLVAAKKTADSANRAKTGVILKIAHEFRTPLNGILGELQNLNDLEPEGGNEYIRNISDSSRRLIATINNVIDFSDLESGTMELKLSVFNLSEELNDLLLLVRNDIIRKNLYINLNVAPETPPFIEGDASRIHRVILSLVENSIKFTDTGGITLDVKVNNRSELEILVKDTGRGIPVDMQSHIFNAFDQGDTDYSFTKDYDGLGLGLSITAKIIRMMDGAMDFTSMPGQGTEFHIRIPVRTISAEAVQENEFLNIQALIVEDNVINAKILGSFLDKIGIASDVAVNGKKGVEKYATGKYNMVFMDVQMPVMNGLDATRAIREKERFSGKRVPIIAVTANARKNECLKAGMDAFMQKPVNITGVTAAVREMVALKTMEPGVPESLPEVYPSAPENPGDSAG